MGQYVFLFFGVVFNLGFYKSSKNIDGFVNCFFVDKIVNGLCEFIVKLGYYSYFGDYMSMEVEYWKVKLRIELVVYGNDFYLFIMFMELDEEYILIFFVEGGLFWNWLGQIFREEDVLMIIILD